MKLWLILMRITMPLTLRERLARYRSPQRGTCRCMARREGRAAQFIVFIDRQLTPRRKGSLPVFSGKIQLIHLREKIQHAGMSALQAAMHLT